MVNKQYIKELFEFMWEHSTVFKETLKKLVTPYIVPTTAYSACRDLYVVLVSM